MAIDKMQQHIASEDHCYKASDFLGYTAKWSIVGVLFGCALIVLAFMWYDDVGAWMPEDSDRRPGQRAQMTPGLLAATGALFAFGRLVIPQARWFRILLDGGLPTDVWEKRAEKLARHWAEVGIEVSDAKSDGVRFIGRSKKNNTFYYWAAVPAQSKIDGQAAEGYAVAHYETGAKPRTEQWVALNLFVPGPLRECIIVLEDCSDDLNSELAAHREAKGPRVSFQPRHTSRLAKYVLRD